MEVYRVRIINPDKSISVLDKSFSQVCAMLKELSANDADKFWDKKGDVVLSSGHSVVFVKQI